MLAIFKRHLEVILSISSMVIAFFAFGLSVNQYMQAQELEKLRNKPHLVVSMGKNNEKGYYWTIENQGLGVARMKWSKVFFDGKEVSHWDLVYEKFYRESNASLSKEILRTFSMLNPETTLHPTSGEAGKIKYLISEAKDGWVDYYWKNRNRLNLVVCYCSLLDECEIKDFSKLDQISFAPSKSWGDECRVDKRYPVYFQVPPGF